MAEPAEVQLIKDQYKFAYHCLGRALAAEQAGRTEEALDYYRMGRQHFAHGVEVPTGAEWQQGEVWDTARQYQQRMRDSLHTVNAHLTGLATCQLTTTDQRNPMLLNVPPSPFNSQPHHTSLHSVCPTLPPRPQDTNTITTPPRPSSCPPFGFTIPTEALGTTAMSNPGEQPPDYTPKPTNGHWSLAFGPDDPWSGSHIRPGQNETELLFIPSGVQLFFVAPNGHVSSLSNPGYLRIVTFDSGTKESTTERPSAFLHVCDRLYPLTTDTPVLLASSGIFMFSDSSMEMHGSFAGIVLSSELPVACRELFKDLLSQLADFRFQTPQGAEADLINLSTKVPLGPPQVPGEIVEPGEKEKPLLPRWSEKMAHGILSGSTWLGQGFIKGAEATSRAIHKGGFKMRDRMTPEETPTEVSHGVTRGLDATKQATGGVLRVSRFLVTGVSKVLGQAAEKVAPHVKKQGAKLVPESWRKHKEGEPSNWDGTKHVASSGVKGFSTVWSSLEEGAKLVGKSVRAETVTSVTYKYGNSAGDATDTALQSVVNVGVTAYNIDNLGIKAILKTAGKQTAKAMVKSPDEEKPGVDETDKQKKDEAQMKK